MLRWLAPLLALSAALAAPARAAAPAPIPVEAFAELAFISDPLLSPDGRRLAARINSGGVQHLAVYDLSAPRDSEPKIVPTPSGARWFSWAGDDRLLIGHYRFVLVLGILPFPATAVSRYELSTGKTIALGKPTGLLGDDVIYTDPDGRFILLSAQDDLDDTPSVDRIDLATGAATEVQRKTKGIWSWFADGAGNVRAGISYGDNGSWTVYRRDVASGSLERLAKVKVPKPGSAVDSVHLLPGSDSGLIVTNERTGRFGVYQYDLASATIGSPVFEHGEVDVTLPISSPDGARVDGVLYEDDKPRIAWFDPELKKIQAQIDRTFPERVNRIVNRSRDGNKVLIWSSAPQDPGQYYIFDRAARRMEVFAAPFERLVDQALAEMRPVRYTARDGLSIPAYLTLPLGRPAKDLPLIVMPHGGPFVRASYGFDPWVQLLANRGYAVLQPNFRGSTGYGRAFVERGYGQMGLGMQDDLDDGVAWLASQGTIDPKRVCLVGASYGGYAALWGAIRNPEIYRCAVSLAGVTDIRAMLKYDRRLLVASRYSKLHRKQIEGEEKRDLAAVSPLQQAARLKVPVLLAHGAIDVTVPADQGRKLLAALRERGAPVQAVFYPFAGHDFGRTEDSLDFMRRMEAFLELHNPAGPPPSGPREASPVSAGISAIEIDMALKRKAKRPAVEIGYKVLADGRVTACAVSQSSGAAALDKEVCRIAEERFQYRPALGPDGRPREASASYTFKWEPPAKAKR